MCYFRSLCGIGEANAAPAHAKCPLGYYCEVESGAVVQKPCSAGKYGTAEGAATEAAGCTDCDPGYYCPGGPASPISCPAGAYCAGALALPTLCPDGTYNKLKLQSALAACLACQDGELCPEGSSWPLDCPSGSHCATGAITATGCNAGTYLPLNNNPDARAGSQAACQACPIGHYCLQGSSNPTPCPSGTYSDSLSGVDDTVCQNCPAGTACPFQGTSDVNSALPCDYGHYCPEGSLYPHANPCPAGKFSDSTSISTSGECGNCPVGYYCTEGSNTFTNPPIICPEGYYCEIDTATATEHPCPAGTYSPNTGLESSSACITCPAGSYCLEGTTAVSGLCDAGYWCPEGSSTAQENPCPLGTFSASTGLKTENECTVCPLGKIFRF